MFCATRVIGVVFNLEEKTPKKKKNENKRRPGAVMLRWRAVMWLNRF